MHILLISRCPPYPLHLGDRLIVWHLVRELGKQGITFDLIALTQKPGDANEQHHYAHLFNKITLIPETPRTAIQYLYRHIRDDLRYPETAQKAWSPELWQAAADHVSQYKYDGVHVFGGIQVYEVAQALKPLSAIITPYESFALYMARQMEQNPSPMNRLQEMAARGFERWMYRDYKRVVVLAEPDAQMLRKLSYWDKPVDVIPNGIDLDYFDGERAAVDPHALLFVGNYEYGPNVEAALLLADQIFPKIRAAIPDATLSLVGNAPPPELIAKQGNGIIVTGRVPSIREAYAQASVFVSPLVTGAGIKNKVLEALAMRLPVVATPLSMDGIRVKHGESALITPIENIAETVIALLRDRDQQGRLGEQGRALIESEYSWALVASRYTDLYRALFA